MEVTELVSALIKLEKTSILESPLAGYAPMWYMAAMCGDYRPFALCVAAIVLLAGCNKGQIDAHPDSYIVVEHITEGDKYVIRHNDLEFETACRNSTFTLKSDRTVRATNCLTIMPVGQEIKVTRGAGGMLYADWSEKGIDWQMHLSIEREELKLGPPPTPARAWVWAMVSGTFLGLIVALLLWAFVFSKNKELQKVLRQPVRALKDKRRERRIPMSVGLELSLLDLTSLGETIIYQVLLENTSPHGARLAIKKAWHTGDRVLVRLPRWDTSLSARVAYCDAMDDGISAIGLQFSTVIDWMLLLPDTINHGLTSHQFRK